METSKGFVSTNNRSALCFEGPWRGDSEKGQTNYPVDSASHICTCGVCGRQFGENATRGVNHDAVRRVEDVRSYGQTDTNTLVVKEECEFLKNVIQDKVKASQQENQNVRTSLTVIWDSSSEAAESVTDLVQHLDSLSYGKNDTETRHLTGISSDDLNQTDANCGTGLNSSFAGAARVRNQTKRAAYANPRLEKSFLCNVCGKQFRRSAQLKNHAVVHSGKRAYVCGDCGRPFSRLEGLRVHQRTHTGEKPYTCGVCDRRFSDAGSCRRHARTHTGAKPFVCAHCGTAFVDPSGLRTHVRAHDGIKPHGCEECGSRFAQATQLKLHRSVHTGEKLFVCDECGKRFTRAAHLKGHLKRHRGQLIPRHACATCDKRFAKATDLKSHALIHSGEKPHLCVTCGKRFRRMQTLRDHQRLHTGDRPYKCSACGAAFAHSSALKLHRKGHGSSEAR